MYLSLDRDGKGRYPNLESEFPSIQELKSIHYNKEITEWLEEAHKQVANITNLSLGIRQYQEVIQKLYGTHGRKVINLYDYIADTESVSQAKRRETVQTIEEIIQEYGNLKPTVMRRFFSCIIRMLESKLEEEKLIGEWKVECPEENALQVSKPWKRLTIKQESTGERPSILFAFEYGANNFHGPYWGIARSHEEIILTDLSKKYDEEKKNDKENYPEFPALPSDALWWIKIESVYGSDRNWKKHCDHFSEVMKRGTEKAAEDFVDRFFSEVITKDNRKLVMKLNESWLEIEKELAGKGQNSAIS